FTQEEVQRLIDEAPTLEWQTLILLGYFLGARLSDCLRLTWENVRPELGIIEYRQQKTGGKVMIPMHYHIIEHLDYLKTFVTTGPLCWKLSAKRTSGKSGLSLGFKKVMKRAGIDPGMVQGMGLNRFSRRSFHSLRHSFNSALANNGVSEELRMKLT